MASDKKVQNTKKGGKKTKVDMKGKIFLAVLAFLFIVGLLSKLTNNTNPLSDAFSAVFALGVIMIPIFLYFLPTVVGRKKKNVTAIFVLNFFLGWTLIGWVIALIWATTKD